MGAKCVRFFVIIVCCLLGCIQSRPLEEQASRYGEIAPSQRWTRWTPLLALAFAVTSVLLVVGCVRCCRQLSGFEEFRNPESVGSNARAFNNPLAMHPISHGVLGIDPVGISQMRGPSPYTPSAGATRMLLRLEALGTSQQLSANANDLSFAKDWLVDKDFPRRQLHYLRECGQGWFGKVVEGEARGILSASNKVYRVVVRILKEDASAAEQAFFLQEAKPFKDLSHPNVLKLLGKCLDNVPFLLVFETCSNGDLRSFLKQNTGNKEALIYQGIVLRMAVDIASGLSYMLQNGFVHTDIAARNCLVTGDLRIKVGDYGTSLYTYKDEYYFNGDIALPIRWCAPETLNCTETTIEPKQVTGASCMWSFGVLLWELEEWGELPYRDLTDEQVIHRVFGAEGLRLPYPANKTPYSQEMCSIMTECWKDYIDRPSFIHVMNSISALLHRFKSNDFDARWYASKPNTVPVCDNDEKLRAHLGASSSLFSKCDNDSGIDLDNPAKLRRLHTQQSTSSRHQLSTDGDFSSESPASSRRFSNSSTGDLFSSSLSSKLRSPSLENLHGSLSSLNRRADDVFEGTKVDFQLGLVSAVDASILWNNKPLFQSDSYLEENSIMKRVCGVDSLGTTDAEEELWRKRIERGEFTEKVKEKSKSVADLMVLTHIDCSESSESDSLPSFHSRQSSFNRQCRRASAKALAAAGGTASGPLSLLNSLSFGSESNLPVVEKDPEFQDALKKIQMAKMSGNEESLNFVSLHTMNSMVLGGGGRAEEKDGKSSHFLANEASENCTTQSSQMNDAFCGGGDASPFEKTSKLPLLQLFDARAADGAKRADVVQSTQEMASDVELSPCGTNDEFAYMSSCSSDNVDSVVIGPCESHTLDYFKGLKTTLVEQSVETKAAAVEADEHFASNPQTLNEFLSDASGDYFYKCAGDETRVRESQERAVRSSYCDYCYQNECLRCRDRSVDENCSCESLENAEKCPFQSDDSGRGTDQINSGDGSSDKSLEGSISVQMNEVKNRLDVIAKFNTVVDDASDDNCSSLEEDKEEEACEEIEIEELNAAEDANGAIEVDLVPVVELAEAEEHSVSADEDTCLDTVIDSSTSNKSAEGSKTGPMFEKQIAADLSRSCELFSRSTNDLTYDVVTESDGVGTSPESEACAAQSQWTETSPAAETPLDSETAAAAAAYEISDILEGLSEPVSLSYSVNEEEEVDSEYEEDCIPSTWLPASLDDSSDEDEGSAPPPRKRLLHVDQSVVEAIRNELREKLPAVCSTLALSEDTDPQRRVSEEEEPTTSAESTNIMIEYNVYQAQLSPILEDDEEAYSSFSSSGEASSASETINASTSCTFEGDDDEDDLLMVNTETNEASLFNAQPRPVRQQHNLNETYEIDENDDTIGLSDPLDSDSVATPDSLSPATSSKTSGAHLSYSSSDCGNLSDVFLSPSSSNKNFDELDMDRSPDDARLLNTPENTLRPALDHQPNHQRTLFNIDEMLKRDFTQLGQALHLDESSRATAEERRSPPWLRSFFRPANEVASLISFHSLGDDEAEFRSLPADFKTECWPTVDELTSPAAPEVGDALKCADADSDTSCTITEEVVASTQLVEQAEMAEKVYVSENETSSSESSQNVSLKTTQSPAGEPPSTPKSKNSFALFGNGPKQIRNFRVSLVEDDSLRNAGKTTKSPESSYWSERLAVSSSADSKKTWKSPAAIFGAYLGSPTFEGGAHALHEDTKEEDGANDMLMSTSFIDSDSQGSSVDGKEAGALRSDDDDSDEEGLESTSEEFVWKENNDTDIAQNDKTFSVDKYVDGGDEDADDDDADDERLADFVPFSWNSDALPKRSSLKAKDRINSSKKNVSFKKQKYHCVYEYPKEEPHYARIYDNMLQERMLSLWNAERDYLYNDYSSFSDWELDDCGEESSNQGTDDFAVSRGPALNSPRPASIPNKLSFYTIGAYDSDPMKSDDSPLEYPNQNATVILESPSPSSSPYPAFANSSTSAAPSSPSGKYLSSDSSPLDWSPVADHANAVEPDTESGGDGTSSTLALGELKHTKNRLKLDLNNTITSYKSSTAEQQSKAAAAKKYGADNGEGSQTSAEENDADDFVNEYGGLKFKSCDISPVVELKSLASTSVA